MTLQNVARTLGKIPYFSPAITPGGFRADKNALERRSWQAAALAIALFVATYITLHPIVFMAATVSLLGALVIYGISDWVTGRALDDKAIEEYITAPYPDQDAVERVKISDYAIQQLIDKKVDLNKRDRSGHYLLTMPFSANIHLFKKLVDSGADLNKKSSDESKTYLEILLTYQKNKCYEEALEYLFQKKIVDPKTYPADQQVNMWLHADAKGLEMLRFYGFDVNIKNSKGFTPLLKLLDTRKLYSTLDKASQIRMLLNSGANPLERITIGEGEYDATTLTSDPEILEILNKRALT